MTIFGMVKQYLGDRPRADTLRPGDARGDGDVDVRGDDRVGVRGEGVLLREPGPELETVNRLVGRLGLGELSEGLARPRVAGDLDRVLGLPGTDSVVRGDAALEREVFLGDEGRDWVPRCREMGEPGTVRWWQQSSSSLSSNTKIFKNQDHKYFSLSKLPNQSNVLHLTTTQKA